MADEVSAQLELLYRAGKETFPNRATALGEALNGIGEIYHQWHDPTVRAGSPVALVKAREINEAVYQRLRRAVLSWQDASYAVVAIAKDFEATDDDAATAAQQLAFTLDTQKMPTLPAPPTLAEVDS